MRKRSSKAEYFNTATNSTAVSSHIYLVSWLHVGFLLGFLLMLNLQLTSFSRTAWCFLDSFSISIEKLFLWFSSSLSSLSWCSSISAFSLFSRPISCFWCCRRIRLYLWGDTIQMIWKEERSLWLPPSCFLCFSLNTEVCTINSVQSEKISRTQQPKLNFLNQCGSPDLCQPYPDICSLRADPCSCSWIWRVTSEAVLMVAKWSLRRRLPPPPPPPPPPPDEGSRCESASGWYGSS